MWISREQYNSMMAKLKGVDIDKQTIDDLKQQLDLQDTISKTLEGQMTKPKEQTTWKNFAEGQHIHEVVRVRFYSRYFDVAVKTTDDESELDSNHVIKRSMIQTKEAPISYGFEAEFEPAYGVAEWEDGLAFPGGNYEPLDYRLVPVRFNPAQAQYIKTIWSDNA